MSSRSFLRWFLPLVLCLPAAPVAAEPPWRPAPPASEPLTLLEAARLTLAHQPGLRLREQEASLGAGILLEESGRFDQAIAGELSFAYDKRELRAAQKKSEREKRDSLSKSITQQQEKLSETEKIRDEIARRRNGDATAPLDDAELEAALDLIDAALENAEKPETVAELEALRSRTLDTALQKYDETIGDLRGSIAEDQSRLAALGRVPEMEEQYQGRALLQWVLPFRNGATVVPFAEYTLDGDRYVGKRGAEEHGGKGIPDAYRTSLGFSFALPLARGSGRVSADAREEAARIEYDARTALVSHAAAASLADTGLAYWDAASAAARLEILAAAEQRQKQIVDLSRALADSEEMPKYEVSRAEAQWASTQAALDNGRRADVSTRVALARVIGMDLRDGEPPHPRDPLPDLSGLPLVDGVTWNLEEVLARRDDLRAARALASAAGVRVRAAERDLLPRIDLAGRAFANSFAESSGRDSLTGRWLAPSYDVKLGVERSLGNRTQEGRLRQALADEALRQIDFGEQERLTAADLVELTASLRAALAEDRAAQAAATGYREAVDAEVEKLRAGESTLVDVLLTEQRWTDARLAAVDARRDLARLLVQLRFTTGTLVAGSGENRDVPADAFTALPPATKGAAQ